jgi:hypothetical protein
MAPGNHKLCQLCRGINVAQLAATGGYAHHQTLKAWTSSAVSCRLCDLILSESRRHSNLEHLQGHPSTWRALEDENFLQNRSLRLHWSKGSDVCRAIAVHRECASSLPEDLLVATKQIHLTSVEIFTDEKDPAAKYGTPSWRTLQQDTACEASMNVIRAWLAECLHSHKRDLIPGHYTVDHRHAAVACPTHSTDTAYVAARLLKITSSHVFALPASEVTEPYATLSYSWGEGPQWPWGPQETARQSLDAMVRQGLCRKSLPKTINDAVLVAEQLGLKYLWVDALCILQDDKDFLKESVKMGTIYAQAFVNLAASCGTDNAAGLFNVRSKSQYHDFHVCICVASSIDDKASRLHFCQRRAQKPNYDDPELQAYENAEPDAYRAEVDQGPLAQRAWVCQERICSPRTIHFGETQLFWQCNQGTWTEDNIGTIESKGVALAFSIIARKTLFSLADLKLFTSDAYPTVEDVSQEWCSAAIDYWSTSLVPDHYSHRKLTRHTDKLLAVAGMAKKLWQQEQRMRYVAGLWWDDSLAFNLLWRASPGNTRISSYVAPSWSWASLVGKVESDYMLHWLDDVVYHCNVTNCWVKTHDKTDQFSRVLDAKLVLEARSLQGRAYQKGPLRHESATLILDGISNEFSKGYYYAILDETAQHRRRERQCFALRTLNMPRSNSSAQQGPAPRLEMPGL